MHVKNGQIQVSMRSVGVYQEIHTVCPLQLKMESFQDISSVEHSMEQPLFQLITLALLQQLWLNDVNNFPSLANYCLIKNQTASFFYCFHRMNTKLSPKMSHI